MRQEIWKEGQEVRHGLWDKIVSKIKQEGQGV